MRERPPYIDPLAPIRRQYTPERLTRMFTGREYDPWFRSIGEKYSRKSGEAAVWAGYELLKYGSEREAE